MFLDRFSLVSVWFSFLSNQVLLSLMGPKAAGYVRHSSERACAVLPVCLELRQSGYTAGAPCLVPFNYFAAVAYAHPFRRSSIVSNES